MPEAPTQPVKPRDAIELTYQPAPKSWRRKAGTAVRLWARDTFSRDSLISSFKSLLWVVPLTFLIWSYAEREQVVTMNNVGINLEAPPADPGRVVRLSGPSGITVHAELQGPQVELEQVKDWLAVTPIPIDVDRNLSPGEHEIPIVDELNRLPRLVAKGVTVTGCMPADVRVTVDPVISQELEIRVRPEEAKGLTAPPVFTPAKVRITGPASVIHNAGAIARDRNQQLIAYANLGQFAQLNEPGKHELSGVPLATSVKIDDPNLILSPVTVSAHIEVQRTEQSFTFGTVRVLAAVPSGRQADQFKPVFEPLLHGVTVVGPEQQIATIKEGIPSAIFIPDYSNLDNPAPAPLIFDFPPGVHVAADDTNRSIKYTFARRSTGDQ